MELIRGLHNLRPRHRNCVATLGAFDGVHLGHQAVIGQLQARARELDLPAVVISFEPLPREYLRPLQAPARLMSFREKCVALAGLGVDRVLRIRFNEAVRTMPPRAFIEQVFVEGLGVKHLVLGDDFRFGRAREGDFEMIAAEGEHYGYQAETTDTYTLDGERVSSTRIRKALGDADFALAERLLSRPYSISGKVVYGRQLGRELGFPTANLQLHRLRSPLSGVYAVRVHGAGLSGAPGVANVGTRPTVNESIRANLEVHLLEGRPELYGRRIAVTFLHKLRDEQRFPSVEVLREQIAADTAEARAWFSGRRNHDG